MTTDTDLLLDFRTHLRACERCELSAHCTSPIPWSGDVNPDLCVMGEAPGKQEDISGLPFVGPTGYWLRSWLKQSGIDPDKVTYMNSVACLPHGTPTAAHVRACRGWMNGQLEFIKPKMLLTLGTIAFSALRGTDFPKLSALHGKPLRHPTHGYPVWHSYHPAAHIRGGVTTVRGHRMTYERVILDDIAAMVGWDGFALEECYVCGDELYRYDEDWMMGLCRRHSARQGILWPEDDESAPEQTPDERGEG